MNLYRNWLWLGIQNRVVRRNLQTIGTHEWGDVRTRVPGYRYGTLDVLLYVTTPTSFWEGLSKYRVLIYPCFRFPFEKAGKLCKWVRRQWRAHAAFVSNDLNESP
jgi:hypothetical protein